MIILVTGISGAGKTYFCKRFLEQIRASHFNNDYIRKITDNHDFSMAGRTLAAQNMAEAIFSSDSEIVLVDMICPTKELRRIIKPDTIVYIKSDCPSQFPDTDALYEEPTADEARYFFSCYTRKVDQLVDRVTYWLHKNPQ